MSIATKRKKIESYILQLCNDIDASGNNEQRYRKLFKKLDNKAFSKWMDNLKTGDSRISIMIPNMTDGLNTTKVINVAKSRNVRIFDKLRYKDPITKREYLTEYPYLVVRLPVRRLSQYLFHKISLPESDKRISPISGQVIPPDKGAALSSIEVQMLASKGLSTSVVELIKVRGGDTDNYNKLKYQIENEGSGLIGELPLGESRTKSVTTANLYLRSLGIKTIG